MNDLNPAELFVPEIRQQLQLKDFVGLKSLLTELNPIDLADAFSRFALDEQILLFRLLDPRPQMIVFQELEPQEQEYVLHHLDGTRLDRLLEGLAPGVMRRLMRKLPEKTVREMETHLSQGQADLLRQTRAYPAESVGALMAAPIASLKPDMTAREALDYLRTRLRVRHEQALQSIYVTNGSAHPIGALSLRSLIAAPVDAKVSELMVPASLIRLPALMDREEAAKIFSRYKLMAAPVVDEENRLIGMVSAGEILRILQQEATEDIQKLGAVQTLEEPYFKISFLKMVRKRGTWLCVLFIGETLTATAMAFFEKEIARAVVLALFIPLIISSGGNSGSQAATLVVRAMALREIAFNDWWRVMRREFATGLALGGLLGALGFLRIFLWSQFTPLYGPHSLFVALTVGCSLVLVVLWGSLSGSLLPIALRKIGLDPASASAPFVATLVDVTGLVIYFVTGLFILKGTLL